MGVSVIVWGVDVIAWVQVGVCVGEDGSVWVGRPLLVVCVHVHVHVSGACW